MNAPGFTAETSIYYSSKHYHTGAGHYTSAGNQQIVLQVCFNECTSFFDDFEFGGPVHRLCERFCTDEPNVHCGPCRNGVQRCVLPHFGTKFLPCDN
jgi:hypothetical protein